MRRAVDTHYSMTIEWSDQDAAYIVSLPEFGGCKTHGSTYEGAARNGRAVLEALVEAYRAERRPLPAPRLFATGTTAASAV